MISLLITIGLSFVSPTSYAYLEPTEVFTDLEIPEATGSNDEQEVAAPTKALPIFYRDGKSMDKTVLPTEEEPEGIFEQEQLDEPEEEEEEEGNILEKQPVIEEEEDIDEYAEEEEEEYVEEEAAPATKKKAGIVGFINQAKYLFAGIGIAAAGALYFAIGRKKSGGSAAPTSKNTPPKPDNPQQVEESSPRLEHALKAMGEDEGKEKK